MIEVSSLDGIVPAEGGVNRMIISTKGLLGLDKNEQYNRINTAEACIVCSGMLQAVCNQDR